MFFWNAAESFRNELSTQDAVASDARLEISSAVSSGVLVLEVVPFSLLVVMLEGTRWNQAAVYIVQEVTCCSLCFMCCVHHSLFACQSC